MQSFTARMPLLTATSAFGLGRRCWSSPQQCYLHCWWTPNTLRVTEALAISSSFQWLKLIVNHSSECTRPQQTAVKNTTTTLHPFNGFFSRTAWVTWYQKGKSVWIKTRQEMMGSWDALASAGQSEGWPHHGHTFSIYLSHSDWLFHGGCCPCLDVVHPGHAWPSSPACTWQCPLHYLFLQATPLFPHGVTIVC